MARMMKRVRAYYFRNGKRINKSYRNYAKFYNSRIALRRRGIKLFRAY